MNNKITGLILLSQLNDYVSRPLKNITTMRMIYMRCRHEAIK